MVNVGNTGRICLLLVLVCLMVNICDARKRSSSGSSSKTSKTKSTNTCTSGGSKSSHKSKRGYYACSALPILDNGYWALNVTDPPQRYEACATAELQCCDGFEATIQDESDPDLPIQLECQYDGSWEGVNENATCVLIDQGPNEGPVPIFVPL